MLAALEKIGKDGKFTARDGHYEYDNGYGESWYWLILSDPMVWHVPGSETIDAVALTPENLTKYGPNYYFRDSELYRINEYDIVTRVIDGKTYAAVYVHLEKKPS